MEDLLAPVIRPLMSAAEINAWRQTNRLVALHMLPSLILALEHAAALVPEDQRAALYADASRARALLAETP